MQHESHIPLEGASNTRDLGWLFGAGGRRRVFRSATLDNLTAAGRRRFLELNVAVIIDLRGRAEAAEAKEFSGVERIHLPIEPNVVGELRAHAVAGTLDVPAAQAVMANTYRRYITDYAPVFAEVLRHVLAARRRPVLFHCAAGKDRTGVAAALILAGLGVPQETIMQDYLLSNQLYRPLATSASEIPPDIRAAIIQVRPSYLEAAFAAIAEGWGSAEAYLATALGIGARERAALHDALTAAG
ncbi:MAG TPA: tyrosine-protein phosphatase [Candidatus Sulfotelmatobacter sp.]|nr:tyrosine-protein phosphatase [Candidatus Sulfotelmatobacter sp.]